MKKIFLFTAILALALVILHCTAEEGSSEGHVHDWTDVAMTKEPTCTEGGVGVRICKTCGEEEILEYAPKDHDFGPWQYYSDALHLHVCSGCGLTVTDSHNDKVNRVISAATDTRLGKSDLTCADCYYNRIRFVSVYGRVYPTDTVDIIGNGTGYYKVNTVELGQGSEKQLTLYMEGTLDIYASTDITYEIYANASNGEFRGVRLIKGSAILSVSSESADLDFIALGDGASLQVEFKDGARSLSILNSEKELRYIQIDPMADGKIRVSIADSVLKADTLTINLDSYELPNAKLIYDGSGFNLNGAKLLQNALWQYDTRTHKLSAESSSGRLTVGSGEETLLNGASGGTVDRDGWYCLYKSADDAFTLATASYSLDGLVAALPVLPIEEKVPETNTDTKTETTTEIQQAEETWLSGETEMSEVYGSSPKITVSFSGGIYSVRVSAMPNGYTLKRIEFIQTYNGALKLKNAFTADADFEVENRSGKISVTVILKDNNGSEKRYAAGEYDYRAN